MDLSVSNSRGARAFMALLSLTMGTVALHASGNVLNPTASVNVTCSTTAGPGSAQNIVIKPVTALVSPHTITVTFTAPGAGLIVTPPATTVLSTTNQSTGITYTVTAVAGCVGASTGATTLHFSAAQDSGSAVADATTTVNDTVTATTSGISALPSSVTVSCTYVSTPSPAYTPGPAQTISLTSQATGGTPFTIDTTTNLAPTWASVGALSSSSPASTVPITFTVQAATGCGGYAVNTSHSGTIHLLNAPAPDKIINVTIQIVPPSPLTVTPVPAAANIILSYVKGSGVTATANVSVTSTVPSAYVVINTSSLPSWLTVDNTSGAAPWALRFSTTSLADSLAPGTYAATVYFQVSGYAPLGVPVTLQVNNKPPKLTVNATQVPLTWTIGTNPPTASITATSTDSPIQYTITTGGTLAPIVSAAQQSGLAYSFGSTIGVSFNSAVFASAQPGAVLTGTVTLTWGTPASTTVVTFLVTVVSPGATLSGLTPASLPTAAPGTKFTVNMTGTGFVGGSDPTLATRVGIVVNNAIVADTNLAISVVNASNITLTITVPATTDANLPFSPTGSGGTVPLGLVNGNASSIPTGTATLTIGVGPIIQGATSASSFIEVTPPTLPTFAPYDMISLWGANFCASGGTGCSSSQILTGAPDTLTLRYPTTLSPDAVSATQRFVTVAFLQHGTATLIANAPLLFVTNNQINLIVPAGVSTYVGSTVDIVVYFGYGANSAATMLKSGAFQVNIAATDPGIFTVGADGMGNGAVLNGNYALITSANPAGARATAADSDTIQIYLTGLGAPTSSADNTATGTYGAPTDCIGATTGTGNYMATLQSATSVSPPLANIDGAVIQSALLNTGRFAPCFAANPTVTIGGIAATAVTYAGFVADTVAGLYQIDAQLPSTTGTFYPNYPSTTVSITNITAPVQLPVIVQTASGPPAVTSQSGVMVWVAPRLLVTGPTGSGLNAQVGVTWTGTVAATEGTGNILYKLSSGLLPAGLALNAGTGVITGRPAANTAGNYTVTVMATDSATTPVTGTVTFTISVAGGLYLTSTGTAPYNTLTFGTPVATVTTVTATGGQYPYSYALTFGGSGTPTGLTIGLHSGVISTTAATLAGTYHVTVTATDSASNPVTGTLTFDIVIALNVTQATGTGSNLNVVTVTGNAPGGTLLYSLDSASQTAGLAIDGTGNITAGTAAPNPYPAVTVTVNDSVALAPGASVEGAGTVGPFTVTVPSS